MSGDDASIVERLQRLTENPIALNQASREELLEIPFLSPALADSILSYRRRNGIFKSRRPLRKIAGTELYTVIKPFFTVTSKKRKRGYLIQKNYYPVDPGKTARKYSGGLWYNKTKLRYFFSQKTSAGFITQKDVGEESIMDFYSGYISYNAARWKLILGQFHFQFGHGLAFSNPFSTQKSAMVLNPLRSLKTVAAPSLSSAENSGLYGLYLNYQNNHRWNFHLFASGNYLDARLDKSGETVTGIRYTGYHRSESELLSKNRVFAQITAAAVSAPLGRNITASLLICHYHYNPDIQFTSPYVSNSDLRRQYFHFTGSTLNQMSLAYSAHSMHADASGEFTIVEKGTPAFSQKLFFHYDRLQFGFSFWRLTKNFQSPRGTVFDDSSPFPGAQQGLYFALKTKLNTSFMLKAYKFFVRDLWRSWFNSLPGLKDEWLLESIFSLPQKQVALRIRQKSNTVSISEESDFLGEEVQTIYRLHYKWTPDKQFRLQSRIAYTHLHPNSEHGIYFFQDFRYSFTRELALYSRITFFQTRSFRSALYEYENDLPGSFANYALYGKGHKWYLMLRFQPFDAFRFWFKLRYLRRYDGAGYASARIRELRFQMDFTY